MDHPHHLQMQSHRSISVGIMQAFPLSDEPKLSSASTNPIRDWQLATLTKGALIDQILKLQHDVELLMEYNESVTQVACPMSAQLTLLGLENHNL